MFVVPNRYLSPPSSTLRQTGMSAMSQIEQPMSKPERWLRASMVYARPISCDHGTDFKYDPEDVVPKYTCGCTAVKFDRPVYVPLQCESVLSTFTIPAGEAEEMGDPNLGVPLRVAGWLQSQQCRVVVSYAICHYDGHTAENRVRQRDGYYVYCGRCYSDMENQEGDFEPEWTEDGYQAITFPEPVCQFDVEYEDETDENGDLWWQVEMRPAHVLAGDLMGGIEAGLELARTRSYPRIRMNVLANWSREMFCAHCCCSIMRVSYF